MTFIEGQKHFVGKTRYLVSHHDVSLARGKIYITFLYAKKFFILTIVHSYMAPDIVENEETVWNVNCPEFGIPKS